jgi:hypothetical protein
MSRRLPGAHLARRFATSLSSAPPDAADEAWAHGHLGAGERALWDRMTASDRRHSIEVARRFVDRRRGATVDEVAGALLHDVGKIEAGLGTLGRVTATVVGPRTRRFRRYHDHEAIGAQLAAAAGADPVTVALIAGHGPAAADLRVADDV